MLKKRIPLLVGLIACLTLSYLSFQYYNTTPSKPHTNVFCFINPQEPTLNKFVKQVVPTAHLTFSSPQAKRAYIQQILYKKAKKTNKELQKKLQEIIAPYHALYLVDPGIKNPNITREKSLYKYNGNILRVKDIVRYAIVAYEVDALKIAYEQLKKMKGFQVVSTKDKIGKYGSTPYVIVRVRDQRNGMLAEVQLYLHHYEVVRERLHIIHEVKRAIQKKLYAEKRPPSKQECAVLEKIPITIALVVYQIEKNYQNNTPKKLDVIQHHIKEFGVFLLKKDIDYLNPFGLKIVQGG